MLDGDSLAGLWIEDLGTTGLVGEERGSGNFSALCRDRLFSEKQSLSGGSFGLGKAVLWRFSHLSTVAFYSRISSGPHAGRERFIVKASLPFHILEDGGEYSGDGWYGAVERLPQGGARAVSLWDDAARHVATRLGARIFGADETGTSILVLGFGDPAHDDSEDDTQDTAQLEDRLREVARRSFWPALARGRLTVKVGERDVDVDGDDVEGRLARMLRTYDARGESETLSNVGDVVVERVSVRLPPRKDGEHQGIDAVADVLIRLADEDETDIGSMTCFRGPGMLIEQRDLRQISLSARPFHAVLVCGEAVRGATEHAEDLEQYLRMAEPPAHDRWVPTPRLNEVYKPGWKVALRRLFEAASGAVRKHVSVPIETSDHGPDRLRRLFRAGAVGGGRSQSDFHFRDLAAEVVDGAWQFRATIVPNLPTDSAWHAEVDVEFREERGRRTAHGTLAQVSADDADCELVDGRGRISAPPGTRAVCIRGETDPRTHPVAVQEAAIELVIRSKVGDS